MNFRYKWYKKLSLFKIYQMNLFELSEKKKRRKKRAVFWGFYGPLLYSFGLLLALGKHTHELCFFNWFCADLSDSVFYKGFIIYLYLLIAALIVIYSYLAIEKLAQKKNHIPVFQGILVLIPIIFTLIIVLNENVLLTKHYFFIGIFVIFSILGLVLIEFRKK